jgi:hypothetical protein
MDAVIALLNNATSASAAAEEIITFFGLGDAGDIEIDGSPDEDDDVDDRVSMRSTILRAAKNISCLKSKNRARPAAL